MTGLKIFRKKRESGLVSGLLLKFVEFIDGLKRRQVGYV